MAAFRIFIADDHEVVRKGLCALLQADPNYQICGEAADGREAVDKVRELKPDAIIRHWYVHHGISSRSRARRGAIM